MSRGKYLSLEEARAEGKFKQFCKEHPSTGDMDAFDQMFEAMALPEPKPKRRKKSSKT